MINRSNRLSAISVYERRASNAWRVPHSIRTALNRRRRTGRLCHGPTRRIGCAVVSVQTDAPALTYDGQTSSSWLVGANCFASVGHNALMTLDDRRGTNNQFVWSCLVHISRRHWYESRSVAWQTHCIHCMHKCALITANKASSCLRRQARDSFIMIYDEATTN